MLHGANSERRRSVVVIDDHPLIGAAVRDLIVRYSRSAVVQLCLSLSAGLSALRFVEPDLIILDLGLPDANGYDAVIAVRAAAPRAYVALLTGNDELARSIPEVRSGAIPFLRKGMPERELSRAMYGLLRRCGLADGVCQFPDEPGPDGPVRFERLSPKQRQILQLLATGRSNHEIAEALHVSAETIKTHLHEIFAKLHVKNRTQAVLLYQSASPHDDERVGGEAL